MRELRKIKQQLNEELKRQKTQDEQQESLLANLKQQKKQFAITLTNQLQIIKEEEKSKRQKQLNLIAEKQQLSNDLMSKLKEKTNEVKVLSGQVETLKDLKVLKDTQQIHELKIKLYSSQHECDKARSHLIEQQKENEKK